ncbi:MAG TPA: cob(I)yrinic acid a,c-diamide adenosyltransferase [Bryobacteraceae bacterium]|nr:cob(I)yrinic acid a,c-diamide adenosyltransferase [Bryobacteraceae bacterium]
MSEAPFSEPRLALNRIYTKRGDSGETSLVGGQRAPKDSLRIECYGTVDELNSYTGMACYTATLEVALAPLAVILQRVQHELFNLGSVLATLPQDVHPKQPQVTEVEVQQLEREIDLMNEALPALRSFVLPGGSEINSILHVCRTVCRRAERLCVTLAREESVPEWSIQYLNRLSDAFFVWSRWANVQLNAPEVLWKPNEAASGRNL